MSDIACVVVDVFQSGLGPPTNCSLHSSHQATQSFTQSVVAVTYPAFAD